MRIDREKALQIVRDVVAERGEDYVYGRHFRTGCNYQYAKSTRNNQMGSCMVGKGLIDLGVSFWAPRGEVPKWAVLYPTAVRSDGRIEGGFTGSVFHALLKANSDLEITTAAQRILRAAQVMQDGDEPYGQALLAAEEQYNKCVEGGIL